MADTKISALPSGAPAQAGDEYIVARGGDNYKLSGTNLITLIANSGVALPIITVTSSTSVSAAKGNHYVLTAGSAATVTLPSSPSSGDVVWVTVGNGRTDNVIARNSQNINSLAENMTVDSAYAGIQLRYADATRGWVFT